MPAKLLYRRGVLVRIGAPDRNAGPGGGHRIGHAKTDAAIAARDKSHLAGQVKRRFRHVIPPYSAACWRAFNDCIALAAISNERNRACWS